MAAPSIERSTRAWTLTASEVKRSLYGNDPAFRLSISTLESRGLVNETLEQLALVLFKPEALLDDRVDTVAAFLLANDFELVAVVPFALTPRAALELWRYQWNVQPIERIALSEILLSLGPSFGWVLRDRWTGDGPTGTRRLAALKGPAEPEARRPGQLRSLLRSPHRIVTYVHLPDEPADLIRDLAIVLGRPKCCSLLEQAQLGASGPAWSERPPGLLSLSDGAKPALGKLDLRSTLFDRIVDAQHLLGIQIDAVRTEPMNPADWQLLMDLALESSMLPTTGSKLIEPLANVVISREPQP